MGLWKNLNEVYEFRRAKQNLLNSVAFRLDRPLTKPENVTFLLTHGCNLTCHMCECGSVGVNPDGGGYIVAKRDEMTREQFAHVIDQLDDWGVKNLIFSGGEVLLRKHDLLALVRHAADKGFNTTVVSNSLAWTEDLAHTFADAGLTNFTSSLDGACAETHDKIRGKPGSFDKVVRTLRQFAALKATHPRLSTNTTTVVQKDNWRELPDVCHLLTDVGVTCIMYQAVSGDYPHLLVPIEELDEFKAVLARLLELKAAGAPIWNGPEYFDTLPRYYTEKVVNQGKFHLGNCLAGYDNLIISPNGTIDICGYGPYGVSLKDVPLLELWHSQAYREARERIAKCETQCLYLCYQKTDLGQLTKQVGGVVKTFVAEALRN
ncbi:MAG: radical SAM protein [bacterium]